MDPAVIVLRLIHILGGVFWAGATFFFVGFLEPSIRESGPDGARVMQGLIRRKYLTTLPIVAGLVILSGIDLLRRASAGFDPAWFRSGTGRTLAAGSLTAILAFGIGVFVMRPAALKALRLSQEAAHSAEPSRDAQLTEAQALRGRARIAARWVAALLAVTVVTMAVARYVG